MSIDSIDFFKKKAEQRERKKEKSRFSPNSISLLNIQSVAGGDCSTKKKRNNRLLSSKKKNLYIYDSFLIPSSLYDEVWHMPHLFKWLYRPETALFSLY